MSDRRPVTKRLAPAHWIAIDVLVALAMLAAGLAFVALADHRTGTQPWLLYLLALVSSLPVAVRRLRPVGSLAVVLVASTLLGVLADVVSTVSAPSYVLYTVAVRTSRTRSLLALAAVEAGVLVTFALTSSPRGTLANEAFTALVQVTVWLIGDGVRRHRAYAADLSRQSIRQAVAEERLRIARELHDVVAHALSVVAVQAGAGAHVIDRNPAEARQALTAIGSTARDALTEMRHLVEVLRSEDGSDDDGGHSDASFRPAPGTDQLGPLVEQFAGAGLPVVLHVEGEPRRLSPSIDLSTYRIVQEALTNVVRHARAPSAVTVTVRYGRGDVAVEITDDGQGVAGDGRASQADGTRPGPGHQHAPGHGLTGMRERVTLFGGELHTGSRPGGGFFVHARLPTEVAAR